VHKGNRQGQHLQAHGAKADGSHLVRERNRLPGTQTGTVRSNFDAVAVRSYRRGPARQAAMERKVRIVTREKRLR